MVREQILCEPGQGDERRVMVAGEVVGETPALGFWVRLATISADDGQEFLVVPREEQAPRLIRWEVIRNAMNAMVFDGPPTAAQAREFGFRPRS